MELKKLIKERLAGWAASSDNADHLMLKCCNSDFNLNPNPNFQIRLIRLIGVVLSNGTLFSKNLVQ